MGARRPSQLEPIGQVMGWRLGHDTMREIDRIVRANIKDPVGPEYMAPPAQLSVEKGVDRLEAVNP